MAILGMEETNLKAKFEKAGRNDPCPCGAMDEEGKPIKFRIFSLSSG
jgi:uncharacterized protein YecA (UPF0149 family)